MAAPCASTDECQLVVRLSPARPRQEYSRLVLILSCSELDPNFLEAVQFKASCQIKYSRSQMKVDGFAVEKVVDTKTQRPISAFAIDGCVIRRVSNRSLINIDQDTELTVDTLLQRVIALEPIVLQSLSKITTRYCLFSYKRGVSYRKDDFLCRSEIAEGIKTSLGLISQSSLFLLLQSQARRHLPLARVGLPIKVVLQS
jgi:hypothetical protein